MNTVINNNLQKAENLLQSVNNEDAIEFSEWIKTKANLRYNKQIPSFPIYNNFIYWCNLGINIGSEQNKIRPCLILKSSNKSPICSVIPLTSKRIHDKFLFHIDLEEIDSTALIEQLRTISKIRIIKPFRRKGNIIAISKNDWNKINLQLEKLYKLRPLKDE